MPFVVSVNEAENSACVCTYVCVCVCVCFCFFFVVVFFLFHTEAAKGFKDSNGSHSGRITHKNSGKKKKKTHAELSFDMAADLRKKEKGKKWPCQRHVQFIKCCETIFVTESPQKTPHHARSCQRVTVNLTRAVISQI